MLKSKSLGLTGSWSYFRRSPIDGGGTVVEGDGIQDWFPRRPGQPCGIAVRWDGMAETEVRLVYVTELEPE